MRQNRIKKFLTAGLSGLLILSLTGCGQAAKLPETVVNTSLVVEKDGKVTSYLVNTFDKDFYNLDGLTQMVEEEAEEFNATHTEATENPMNVKTVQVLGDGVMVQVVQEFADTDSYAEYNEQDLFYGTRVEALAQGLTVNRELVNAADGTPADSEKLDKALEKNHLIITNASAYIYCPYPVLYISEGVVMGEGWVCGSSQSDGVVTILIEKIGFTVIQNIRARKVWYWTMEKTNGENRSPGKSKRFCISRFRDLRRTGKYLGLR